MSRKAKADEAGMIVGRHHSWRGAMISVAVTLSNKEWDALTRACAEAWEEVEDELEMRKLTLDERIALFVSGQAYRWSRQANPDRFDNDLDDDVPF